MDMHKGIQKWTKFQLILIIENFPKRKFKYYNQRPLNAIQLKENKTTLENGFQLDFQIVTKLSFGKL